MEIDHLHFYLDDLERWRQWFTRRCACQEWGRGEDGTTRHRLLGLGQVPILISSPRHPDSPVAQYLRQHPPGLADVAFRVPQLAPAIAQYQAASPGSWPAPTIHQGEGFRWCRVPGWGSLHHTLVERPSPQGQFPGITRQLAAPPAVHISAVDHVVLNVPQGQLATAVAWYEQRFGFRRRQSFQIATPRSGLQSQVLEHPQGSAILPINQPTTLSSQIQEFLDHNRGAGIQHAAFRTPDILRDVTHLRRQGLRFLSVPADYYRSLRERPNYSPLGLDPEAIAQAEILVDWSPQSPQARLLQTFTQPIFDQPTCFFELIERQSVCQEQQQITAAGFGEGNFKALFEAIEREQMQRGSLGTATSAGNC